MSLIMITILAYCLGSINTAILVSRWRGAGDPRNIGSGNAGTTNVLRTTGKKAALLTLIGDILKGFLAVNAACLINVPYAIELALFAVFIGHLYPVFFQFKGGKGVATLLGAWFGANWLVAILLLLTWLCTVVVSRYSSLGAIIAALCAPGYVYMLMPEHSVLTLTSLCISVLLLWKHRANISRLYMQQEPKL